MKILAFESSCDETAAAVVEDGRRILSDVVLSQIDIHHRYGGVVPEIASRALIRRPSAPFVKKHLPTQVSPLTGSTLSALPTAPVSSERFWLGSILQNHWLLPRKSP